MSNIAERLVSQGGAALFADYGYAVPRTGDSLQAVKSHQYHPVLEEIGTADVTAHVDFSSLMTAAQSARACAWGVVEQSEFLDRLGIHQRAEALVRGKDDATKRDILSGVRRLTATEQMGRLFKVISICGTADLHPAGFGKAECHGSGD